MSHETSRTRGLLASATTPVTLYRLLVPVVAVGIWQLLTLWLGGTVLPGPVQTFEGILAGLQTGWIQPNSRVTLEAVFISFVFASLFGGIAGLALGTKKLLYDITEPVFLSIYSVPRITLYPIFLFLFGGVGLYTKLGYATFSAVFPMLIITMGAVRGVEDVYFDVARSMRLSKYQLFRHILLPSILVQLVVALRIAFNAAFLGVILVELFAAKSGLGLVLQQAMGSYDSEQIMVVITILTLVAFAVNVVFYGIQQYLEKKWNISTDSIGL